MVAGFVYRHSMVPEVIAKIFKVSANPGICSTSSKTSIASSSIHLFNPLVHSIGPHLNHQTVLTPAKMKLSSAVLAMTLGLAVAAPTPEGNDKLVARQYLVDPTPDTVAEQVVAEEVAEQEVAEEIAQEEAAEALIAEEIAEEEAVEAAVAEEIVREEAIEAAIAGQAAVAEIVAEETLIQDAAVEVYIAEQQEAAFEAAVIEQAITRDAALEAAIVEDAAVKEALIEEAVVASHCPLGCFPVPSFQCGSTCANVHGDCCALPY